MKQFVLGAIGGAIVGVGATVALAAAAAFRSEHIRDLVREKASEVVADAIRGNRPL